MKTTKKRMKSRAAGSAPVPDEWHRNYIIPSDDEDMSSRETTRWPQAVLFDEEIYKRTAVTRKAAFFQ